MSIPHQFPSLLSGSDQSVLIAGTGLSAGIAPTLKELKPKLDAVANSLTDFPIDDPTKIDPYDLAGAILKKLETDGMSANDSRLFLAEALGMLDDRCWFGETGVRRNTPRHRALARFAVEKRFRAIISLNWDALLEAALDAVGLSERPSSSSRPWELTQYARVVDDVHIPLLSSNRVFPVIKPHGCVREIERAKQAVSSGNACPPLTLKITDSELNVLPADQTLVDKRVQLYISECRLLAVGWKASEKYLRKTIITAIEKVSPSGLDLFTLISRSWYEDHDEIANAYKTKESQAFLKTEKDGDGDPTVDCVLQWLQALYALGFLIGSAAGEQREAMEKLREKLKASCSEHSFLQWADTWLPSWVRMCWRAGKVQGVNPETNEKIAPWEMPIIPRDLHIPLSGIAVEREDLKAAAKLLVTIQDVSDRFDFERFPGGLWDVKNQILYLPLPGCRGGSHVAALSALKPMIEVWDWTVKDIKLIWLDSIDRPPDASDLTQLEAQVRVLLPLTASMASDPLTWVELDALKGA